MNRGFWFWRFPQQRVLRRENQCIGWAMLKNLLLLEVSSLSHVSSSAFTVSDSFNFLARCKSSSFLETAAVSCSSQVETSFSTLTLRSFFGRIPQSLFGFFSIRLYSNLASYKLVALAPNTLLNL